MRLRGSILSRVCFVYSIVSCGLLLGGVPGTLKWSFPTGNAIQGSAAIGPNGVIYVGSRDRTLYAVNPDGTERWSFSAPGQFFAPVAIADDGTILAADDEGNVHALDPEDGTTRWTFATGLSNDPSEMAIAQDGTVYIAFGSDYFAINPDGTQFWTISRPTESLVPGISIGPEGVVLATNQGRLIALDPLTGAEKWIYFSAFGGSRIAPAFAEDGTIYFGQLALGGDNFFAVNPDGTEKWKVALEGHIDAGPATSVDGVIYVPLNFKVSQGMNKGILLALSSIDGSELWRYDTDGGIGTVPAVGFDGTIYFATTSNKLIALSPTGAELWVFDDQSVESGPLSFNSSPTIGADGTVYFGSARDNRLYAICGNSSGPAASSWPMARRDIRNSGRFDSDVSRRRWFASQVYWLDDENNAVATISNVSKVSDAVVAGGGGTTAAFRIDVLNRDGSVFFSIEDSVDPGQTKDIVLAAPGNAIYAGAAIIDASVKDGSFLAPHLTWNLEVPAAPKTLRIGASWLDPTDAAQVHHFPAEASADNGLGIGVLNIGRDAVECLLELFNEDGSLAASQVINLGVAASRVEFFNELVLGDASPQGLEVFKGRGTFTCEAPVAAIAVNQDFANGNFPTDRITIKGVN